MGSREEHVECAGIVASRGLLRAQRCMENRNVICMCPERCRSKHTVLDLERQIMEQS